VLLAQGEFAAFLRATELQRAAILERLTRTDIYKRIGERAAMIKKARELTLREAEAQQKGVVVLSAEELASLSAKTEEMVAEIAQLDGAIAELRQREAWLGRLAERPLAHASAVRGEAGGAAALAS